jgi:hypothetical protein
VGALWRAPPRHRSPAVSFDSCALSIVSCTVGLHRGPEGSPTPLGRLFPKLLLRARWRDCGTVDAAAAGRASGVRQRVATLIWTASTRALSGGGRQRSGVCLRDEEVNCGLISRQHHDRLR